MIKFRNSNQLKSFMKKESERLGIGIQNTYITFFARDLLEKLSKYNDGMVLVKGSCAETAYLGRLVRGITDVDFACLGSYSDYEKLLHLSIDSSDDCQYQATSKPFVTPTGIYKTSMRACIDKTKQPIHVDVQENYNRLIRKDYITMPKIFEDDLEFKIVVPSFEEYLAEKLCIIVESNKEDVLNTRVKDFYDIYQLHGGKYCSEQLTKYFREMLLRRGKISLEKASTEHLNKSFVDQHYSIWEKVRKKYNFLDDEVDLYGAVYYTRAVLREELQKNGIYADLPIVKNKQKLLTK